MNSLSGKRILITRPREQAERTAALLREHGAIPVVMPTIEIVSPRDFGELDRALGSASSYDFIAFTSENGVVKTFERLAAIHKNENALKPAKIAAIGPGTATALQERGVAVDVRAKESIGEGLAAAMIEAMGEKTKTRVLVLRAKEAREVFPTTLRDHGCIVDVVTAYETRQVSAEEKSALARVIQERAVDAVVFTSASTVTSLCDALGAAAGSLLAPIYVASIGRITTKAAENLGVRVDATANEATQLSLVRAVASLFK